MKTIHKEIDILLICPPPGWQSFLPIGLGYLATHLRTKGLSASIYDMARELSESVDPKVQEYLWGLGAKGNWLDNDIVNAFLDRYSDEVEKCIHDILSFKTNLIGFSIIHSKQLISLKLIQRIKDIRPDIRIVAGGMACFYDVDRQAWLEKDKMIDAFVIGEGEESLCELMTKFQKTGSFRDVPGCCSLEGGYEDFKSRECMKDLSSIDFPIYPGLDLADYGSIQVPLFWSRSCIGQCSFCEIKRAWDKYRERSVEDIMKELDHYVNHVGRREFSVFDSVVNVNVGRLKCICDEICKLPCKIEWECNLIAHAQMDEEVYEKLKKAGCKVVYFGIESGSDHVLKVMQKPFSVSEAERNIRFAHEAGLTTSINFITGFPGETEENFNETLQFVERNKEFIDRADFVTECQVARGTKLFQQPDTFNIVIPEAWDGYKWFSKDGMNTNELRQKRTEILQDKLRSSGIHVMADYNLNDGLVERKNEIIDALAISEVLPGSDAGLKSNAEVILITSPPWGVHNPPVGLAYLSTYLRNHNISTHVFDFNILLYKKIDPQWHKLWLPGYKNWWSSEEKFEELKKEFEDHIQWAVEEILKGEIPIIAFSVVDPKERITIDIIQRIHRRDPHKMIILGGPAVSTVEQREIFQQKLGPIVNYYVVGEGEEILYDIVRVYKEKQAQLENKGKMEIACVVRKEIVDLNVIPYPTYDEFDFSLYIGGSMIVEWSRGCISSCVFCKGRDLLGHYRMKDATYIANELEYHYYRHGATYFVVCDNLLNGNIHVLEEACELLIEKKLPIQWEGQAIPYRKMTFSLLQKMKQAGCCKIQWGLESGSDKVLQNIQKGKIFSVKEAEAVIRNAHEAGLETQLFIIIGLPGEDESEFKKTEEFLKKNHKYIDRIKSINTLHLVHGTDLFNRAEEFGLYLPEQDWHYLWKEKNGYNDYEQRVDRTHRLIHLADTLGIVVQEHNLLEGKI